MNVEQQIRNSKPLELRKKTIIHLMLSYHRVMERFNGALKPYDISLQQFNVLRILRGLKGAPASLGTLNERMVSPMSNTTRLVDKLISKGFVTRELCPNNRRKVEIRITGSGLSTLDEIDAVVDHTERQILETMEERELSEFNRLLDKIQV